MVDGEKAFNKFQVDHAFCRSTSFLSALSHTSDSNTQLQDYTGDLDIPIKKRFGLIRRQETRNYHYVSPSGRKGWGSQLRARDYRSKQVIENPHEEQQTLLLSRIIGNVEKLNEAMVELTRSLTVCIPPSQPSLKLTVPPRRSTLTTRIQQP